MAGRPRSDGAPVKNAAWYKAQLDKAMEVATEYAVSNGLCGEFDNIIELINGATGLGLSVGERPMQMRVEFTLTGDFTGTEDKIYAEVGKVFEQAIHANKWDTRWGVDLTDLESS